MRYDASARNGALTISCAQSAILTSDNQRSGRCSGLFGTSALTPKTSTTMSSYFDNKHSVANPERIVVDDTKHRIDKALV